MESKHICKICSRSFANGKSMGGHMRSHFAKLQIQPKQSSSQPSGLVNAPRPITSQLGSDSSDGFLSLSLGQAHGSPAYVVCPTNMAATMELGVQPSAQKRSKRTHHQFKGLESARRSPPPLDPKYGNFSSPDELVTDEDVARCLILLSKGKWCESKDQPKVVSLSDSGDKPSDVKGKALADCENSDGDEDSFDSVALDMFGHRCGTCNRVFKSYQALGGHMRNHKRPFTLPSLVVEKQFPCEMCDKVFESGQALGGHKKVHYTVVRTLPVGNEIPIIQVDSDSDSESDPEFMASSSSESGF